eukprot:SAG11_NODE_2166_length_3726_cov_6.269369_1_plen_180_part_00
MKSNGLLLRGLRIFFRISERNSSTVRSQILRARDSAATPQRCAAAPSLRPAHTSSRLLLQQLIAGFFVPPLLSFLELPLPRPIETAMIDFTRRSPNCALYCVGCSFLYATRRTIFVLRHFWWRCWWWKVPTLFSRPTPSPRYSASPPTRTSSTHPTYAPSWGCARSTSSSPRPWRAFRT